MYRLKCLVYVHDKIPSSFQRKRSVWCSVTAVVSVAATANVFMGEQVWNIDFVNNNNTNKKQEQKLGSVMKINFLLV